jgi:hypothetical protein
MRVVFHTRCQFVPSCVRAMTIVNYEKESGKGGRRMNKKMNRPLPSSTSISQSQCVRLVKSDLSSIFHVLSYSAVAMPSFLYMLRQLGATTYEIWDILTDCSRTRCSAPLLSKVLLYLYSYSKLSLYLQKTTRHR